MAKTATLLTVYTFSNMSVLCNKCSIYYIALYYVIKNLVWDIHWRSGYILSPIIFYSVNNLLVEKYSQNGFSFRSFKWKFWKFSHIEYPLNFKTLISKVTVFLGDFDIIYWSRDSTKIFRFEISFKFAVNEKWI